MNPPQPLQSYGQSKSKNPNQRHAPGAKVEGSASCQSPSQAPEHASLSAHSFAISQSLYTFLRHSHDHTVLAHVATAGYDSTSLLQFSFLSPSVPAPRLSGFECSILDISAGRSSCMKLSKSYLFAVCRRSPFLYRSHSHHSKYRTHRPRDQISPA